MHMRDSQMAQLCSAKPLPVSPLSAFLKRMVQGVGGADEAEVGEGLGKIAEVFAFRPEFLGIESDMIGVAQHLFENEASLLRIASAGEGLGVPECANTEGSLHPRDPIGRSFTDAVTVNERVFDQLVFDGAECGKPAGIGWRYEFHQRHEQAGSIHGA
jgi:hypothetical protein